MEKKGQGALEYLLLLAAAVVVVAVVISYMIGTISTIEPGANQSALDLACKTLNQKNLICGCYLCDKTIGGYSEVDKLNHMAGVSKSCTDLFNLRQNPLLNPTHCQIGDPTFS